MKKTFITSQAAIKKVKYLFEESLSSKLNLVEVQAPLLTKKGVGIQDDLSGYELAVQVPVKALSESFEVVHSLAKWKRQILTKYQFERGEGLYTNMKALRPDEDRLTPIHSVCVDQWDWEQVICPTEDRKIGFLKQQVEKIYLAMKETQKEIEKEYGLSSFLPEKITFLHSEELLSEYPKLSSKEREKAAAKKYGAIFLIGIGGKLSSGDIHDVRAPDYDDWTTINCEGFKGLNGDIIVWNPILEDAFEISSMGIRVSPEALDYQLKTLSLEHKKELDWHKELLSSKMLQTIGGGIGQSRMAMLLLQKPHIGQVQVGVWDKDIEEKYQTL